MKLSIITPIYRESKYLDKFFEKIIGQKNSNFELILISDTNAEDVLSKIEKYKSQIKGKMKLVFNSKRVGRVNAISYGVEIAEGEYSVILSVTDSFDENMVEDALKMIKSKETDIIEFRARFKEPIKFQGRIRKTFNKELNPKNNENTFAYTYPFEFNKIFKTSLLHNVFKLPSFSKRINSRYSIELIFKALLLADSYATVNVKLIRSKRVISSTFNPLKVWREWEDILKNELFHQHYDSLKYNLYYVSSVILLAITGVSKNKVLLTKFIEKHTSFFDASFFELNKFYLSMNKETEILRNQRYKPSVKTYKEFYEKGDEADNVEQEVAEVVIEAK